jgi:hypothetical protein
MSTQNDKILQAALRSAQHQKRTFIAGPLAKIFQCVMIMPSRRFYYALP